MDKGERTREHILQVALEQFAAKGPAGSRVNEIADAAEINKERLYAYFGNKDGLFSAVLARCFERLRERDRALEALGDADIPELPAILLRHFLRTHQEEPALWRLLTWENLAGGTHRDAIGPLAERGYHHVAALYAAGQKQGRFPRTTSFASFIAALIGIAYFRHSNRLTMERSLGADAGDARFAAEVAALFASDPGR